MINRDGGASEFQASRRFGRRRAGQKFFFSTSCACGANRMGQPSLITPNAFQESARARLKLFLEEKQLGEDKDIIALTPDASTREYFRIPWRRRTAIAAVYPEPFDPDVQPYLDVTRLFLAAELPVPEIYEVAAERGIIVQEDLGDQQLRLFFESASEEDCEA